MPEIIYHNYPTSTFARKVRVVFGFKGLSWRSVLIPDRMPKPDLMPLTGGYRSTPVMQIGADVYCDTQCIIRELERRFPEPTLFPGGSEGLAWGLGFWTDKVLYTTAVGLVFGAVADKLDPGYIEDRIEHRGGALDVEKLKAELPQNRDQLRAQLGWVEAMLADGRDFVLGAEPGLADINIYFVLWMVGRLYPAPDEVFGPFAKVTAWMGRMEALGEGDPSEMTAAEALDVARTSEPEPPPPAEPDGLLGLSLGAPVTVVPDDKGRVPVLGELVAAGLQTIAIRRHDERVGEVVLHFPRAGFQVFDG